MASIREQLKEATQVPKVGWFAQLAAQLQMCGANIVPERYWDRLGKWLGDNVEVEDVNFSPFTYIKNHARSEAHEMWQWSYFKNMKEGVVAWIIPIEELICLDYGSEDACDFVSISRLLFTGTEEELDAAIEELLKHAV